MAVDEAVEKKSRRRRKDRNEEDNEQEETEAGLTEAKGYATPGKRNRSGSKKKEQGGNFITRSFRGMVEYLQGVQDELDKVVWPTREDLIRLTRIVIGVTIASAFGLGAFAFLFTFLFAEGLDNEIVFVIFGAFCVVLYFAYQQYSRRQQQANLDQNY